jgi:malate dehydrogenase (oxaloacetate-decarboxylating)(NADP+)
MYVFPGIGLGAILARVKTISDKMIEASALALSDAMTDEEKSAGLLYPRLDRSALRISYLLTQFNQLNSLVFFCPLCKHRIRDISTSVALRVIRQAQEEVSNTISCVFFQVESLLLTSSHHHAYLLESM